MEGAAVVPSSCRVFTFVGQFVLLVSVLATVVTWLPLELTKFKVADTAFRFSLFRCVDCDEAVKDYSYTCIDKVYCDTYADGLCDLGKLQQLNASIYAAFAAIGVVCQLLVVVRLGAMRNKLDYGHARVMWILILVGWVSIVIAGIVWIAYGEIKFDGSCSTDDPTSSVDVCASTTAYFIPSAIGLVSIGSIAAAFAMRTRNPILDVGIKGVANGTVAGLSHRKWLLKIAFAQIAAVVFIALSLDWRWVHYNDTTLDSKSYGQLLIWQKFDTYPYEDYGHNCLSSHFCSNDDSSPFCKGFKKLDKATRLFMAFEYMTLLCIVFWLEHVVYLLMKREFGFVRLNYLWPPLAFVFHTCGFASYVAVSEVSFGADCDYDYDSTSLNFCAEQGPQFVMWSMICLTFGALFSDLIYLKRYVRGIAHGGEKDLKSVSYKLDNTKSIESFDHDTTMNASRTSQPLFDNSPTKKHHATVAPALAETVSNAESPLNADNCVSCHKS
jgi:hypothetical protein